MNPQRPTTTHHSTTLQLPPPPRAAAAASPTPASPRCISRRRHDGRRRPVSTPQRAAPGGRDHGQHGHDLDRNFATAPRMASSRPVAYDVTTRTGWEGFMRGGRPRETQAGPTRAALRRPMRGPVTDRGDGRYHHRPTRGVAPHRVRARAARMTHHARKTMIEEARRSGSVVPPPTVLSLRAAPPRRHQNRRVRPSEPGSRLLVRDAARAHPVRKAAGVFGPKYRATRAPHGPRSFYAVVGRARAICAYPGRSVGRSGRRISPVGRCS